MEEGQYLEYIKNSKKKQNIKKTSQVKRIGREVSKMKQIAEKPSPLGHLGSVN